MSWRQESTFKPSSALVDEEKEFLKLAKKLREILKLEERSAKGETLEPNQQDKLTSKDKLLKEVSALAAKLPGETECLHKNQDITDLLPNAAVRDIEKKRRQEEERRHRREERTVEERKKPEFMCRHDRPILGIAISKDGKHLFTCSKDKYVLCWSLEKALLNCVVTFAGHNGAVFALDVSAAASSSPAWLLSGGADGQVLLWQGEPSKHKPGTVAAPVRTLEHGGIVRVLRWCPFDDAETPNGRRFASASEKLGPKPPCIAVWQVSAKGEMKQILILEDLPTKANDLQWGGGTKLKLFSAHDNGYIGVWMAEAPGSLLKTVRLHAGPVSSLCITADGNTLVTASHDATAMALDITQRETPTVATWRSNRPLNAVVVSQDFRIGAEAAGKVILAGGKDPRDVTRSKDMQEDEFEAKVLDSSSGEILAAGKGHFGPIHALLVLPRLCPGGAFASASEDGCLRVHSLQDGKLLHSDTLQ